MKGCLSLLRSLFLRKNNAQCHCTSPRQVLALVAATLAQAEGASGSIMEEVLKAQLEAKDCDVLGFGGKKPNQMYINLINLIRHGTITVIL